MVLGLTLDYTISNVKISFNYRISFSKITFWRKMPNKHFISWVLTYPDELLSSMLLPVVSPSAICVPHDFYIQEHGNKWLELIFFVTHPMYLQWDMGAF